MHHLVSKLDNTAPRMHSGNWAREYENGWRWEDNVKYLNIELSTKKLDAVIMEFGKENVALGHPFDEAEHKPLALPDICGLYVRDVEDQVKALAGYLDDDNQLAAWLDQ